MRFICGIFIFFTQKNRLSCSRYRFSPAAARFLDKN